MRIAKKYLLVASFFVHAGFAAASDPAKEWETATPQSVGADPRPLKDLAEAIGHGDFPKTTSVLIVYRNRLIYDQYFGDGGPDLLNDTRPATKSITSLAVGVAIRDGAVTSVTAPAFEYLTVLAPFQNDTQLKREITVEDLLTMSSALDRQRRKRHRGAKGAWRGYRHLAEKLQYPRNASTDRRFAGALRAARVPLRACR